MNDYKYTPEKLYEATDGGLMIIHRYLPDSVGNERTRRPFRTGFRPDTTPSAMLYKGTESWYVKDFGDAVYSPLKIFEKVTGITDFREALERLYAEFGVSENSVYVPKNKTFTDASNLPDGYFKIQVKKQVERPQVFSEFVTAEICQKYNVFEVDFYEMKTKTGKLMRVESTDFYPIFCYSDNLEVWAKMYCPAEKKVEKTDADGKKTVYNFKHGYLGTKPARYWHGLQAFKEAVSKIKGDFFTKKAAKVEDETTGEKAKDQAPELPCVVICSGGSDGLTLASLGENFYPIWGNSENDIIDAETLKFLKDNAKEVYYLPDMDASGIEFAYDYSRAYWQLPIILMPKKYLGEKGKDFRDFVKFLRKDNRSKKSIERFFFGLAQSPVSFDFVKEKGKKHRISLQSLYYFLNSEGFFCTSPEFFSANQDNETNDYLIQIQGFKVLKTDAKKVREHCKVFLRSKGASAEIIDMLDTCQALRASDLKNVPNYYAPMDFSDAGADFQHFFFDNCVIEITANGVDVVQHPKVFVKDENIIAHNFRKKEPLFEVLDENGKKTVKILEKNCDFMNFLINTSRVFWKKEYEAFGEDFRKEFTLNSPALNDEECATQHQHFLSKCFAIGYLLHNYKRRGFEKFVYMVDDRVKQEQGENNGRSGKGLLVQGISHLVKPFFVNGKSAKGFDNDHILGAYNGQKLIFFDDMLNNEKTHGFERMFTMITDFVEINKKNKDSYTIPFEKAPKLFGTYNHVIKNLDSSTLGRILFVTFSDYYSFSNGVGSGIWQPAHDFGHQLFSDWNEGQWHLFYNFMAQCTSLYMRYLYTPITLPSENLEINTLKAAMGDAFFDWAENYFEEDYLNVELLRSEVQKNYDQYAPKYRLSSTQLRKCIELYCQFKGYEFNPVEMRNSQGKIKKRVKGLTSPQEFFFIRAENLPTPDEENDDVPF